MSQWTWLRRGKQRCKDNRSSVTERTIHAQNWKSREFMVATPTWATCLTVPGTMSQLTTSQ